MNQQQDVAVWILTAVVGALGVIMWWSIRAWIKGINEKIAEIMAELRVVGNKNIGFEKDISRIDENSRAHEKRFHDHSERIRTIEQTQARCRNCNEV